MQSDPALLTAADDVSAGLSQDQRDAKKAADKRKKEVAAAILAALLFLRSKSSMALYWLPSTWDSFGQMAAKATSPAWEAYDDAAKSVWMGFDGADITNMDEQRRYTDQFVQEISAASRRGIEKVIAWIQVGSFPEAEGEQIFSTLVGLNANQIGPILYQISMLKDAGADMSAIYTVLKSVSDEAIHDRAGLIAEDLLWDAIQHGRVAGGRQEQRSTNQVVVKTWFTEDDERVCNVCGPLHGVSVGVSEPFPGGFNAPKAHSKCRCWAIISVQEARF